MSSLREDRSGLARYGVTPTPVVRTPARNPDSSVICPECGQSVDSNRGTHRIRCPDLADRELLEAFDDPLFVHGWRCTQHRYDVVIPVPCRGREASNLSDGWIGVRLVFADEIVRWVPTPKRELDARGVEL